MLESVPLPIPRWRWFFVIRNGDLFWINRSRWPKRMQHKREYHESGVAWYTRRCAASILPLEHRSYRPVSGPENPEVMDELVEAFRAKYGGLGILEAKAAGGQGGLTVLCVRTSVEMPFDVIPLYFRGVRVSVGLASDVRLEHSLRDGTPFT